MFKLKQAEWFHWVRARWTYSCPWPSTCSLLVSWVCQQLCSWHDTNHPLEAAPCSPWTLPCQLLSGIHFSLTAARSETLNDSEQPWSLSGCGPMTKSRQRFEPLILGADCAHSQNSSSKLRNRRFSGNELCFDGCLWLSFWWKVAHSKPISLLETCRIHLARCFRPRLMESWPSQEWIKQDQMTL